MLLNVPGCLQYDEDPTADLKQYMQRVFDPHDKLDEIAIVFAWNYYALLSAGGERLRDLAPLYSESSVSEAHSRGAECMVGRVHDAWWAQLHQARGC